VQTCVISSADFCCKKKHNSQSNRASGTDFVAAALFQPLIRIDTSHILSVTNLFIEYYMIKKVDFCKKNFAPFEHPT
jgi:hypothetical protein